MQSCAFSFTAEVETSGTPHQTVKLG